MNKKSISLLIVALFFIFVIGLLVVQFIPRYLFLPSASIPKENEAEILKAFENDRYRNPEIEIIGYGNVPYGFEETMDTTVCVKVRYEKRMTDSSWQPGVRSIIVYRIKGYDIWYHRLGLEASSQRAQLLWDCPAPFEHIN